MGYCFMSIEKIKTKASMVMKYQHNFRTEEVLNADPEKAHLNEELVKLHGSTYVEAFDKRMASLPFYQTTKIRSNAVLAMEVVTTFSREDAEIVDVEKWKERNVEWLKEAFNIAKDDDNVISVVYHGDENGNVHCHACVIPIDSRGRLNSCEFIGGRMKMIQLQDSYAEKMKEFGLQRGLRGSVAKHTDIKRFYTSLNQEIAKELPPVRKKGLLKETTEEYRERANEVFKTSNLQHLQQIKKMERKIVEARTLNLQDVIETKKTDTGYQKKIKNLEKKLSEVEEFERTRGPLKTAAAKLEAFESLIKGASEYVKAFPEERMDIQHMKKTMEKVLKYKKKIDAEKLAEEKKSKELEKEFEKNSETNKIEYKEEQVK